MTNKKSIKGRIFSSRIQSRDTTYFSFATKRRIPINTKVYEPKPQSISDWIKKSEENALSLERLEKINKAKEVLRSTNFRSDVRRSFLVDGGKLIFMAEFLDGNLVPCSINESETKRFKNKKLIPRKRTEFKQDELLESDVDKNQKKEYDRKRTTNS